MPMTPSVLPRGAQATASHPPDTSRFHKNFLLSTSTSIVPHIHRPSYPSPLLSIVPLIHCPSYPSPLLSISTSIVPHVHRPSYPLSLLSIGPLIHHPYYPHPHPCFCPSFRPPIPLIHKTPLLFTRLLLSSSHPCYPQDNPHFLKPSAILSFKD